MADNMADKIQTYNLQIHAARAHVHFRVDHNHGHLVQRAKLQCKVRKDKRALRLHRGHHIYLDVVALACSLDFLASFAAQHAELESSVP